MSESDKKINIDYVAQLARLELSDDDKAKLSGQLNDILVYFEKLNSVNVDGIEPIAHTHKVGNVWREGDKPGAVYSKDVLKAMAPESREDQVVVPKVVE